MNSKQMEGAVFLLFILFGVLLLSGIPFLVSNHPARMGNIGFEGFQEGASDKTADTTKEDIQDLKDEIKDMKKIIKNLA
jgi:hypothetical protein